MAYLERVEVTEAVRDTGVVPRQISRDPGPDDWASSRIRDERERRGWSTGELARRVTAAGCKINQSSVWHIESGEPRRKISLGEAVAFAKVFGLSLQELMREPEELKDGAAAITAFFEGAAAVQAKVQDVAEEVQQFIGRLSELSAVATPALASMDVDFVVDPMAGDLRDMLEAAANELMRIRNQLIEHPYALIRRDDPKGANQ